MIDAKRMESGSTKGTIPGIEKSRNFIIKMASRSFPASSLIKSQTVWRTNIKKRITNTEVNVIRKVFRRYLSRIFTYVINLVY